MVWPIAIDWVSKILMDISGTDLWEENWQLALINEGFYPPARNNAKSVGYEWWRWGN